MGGGAWGEEGRGGRDIYRVLKIKKSSTQPVTVSMGPSKRDTDHHRGQINVVWFLFMSRNFKHLGQK